MRARARVGTVLAAMLLLAATVAACGPTATPASPTATTPPTATTAASALASGVPSATEPASGGSSPDTSTPLTIDSSLLGFLPAQVATFPVQEDLDEAAKALGDPVLPDIATGIDAAVAVDAGNGNLVYALVVQLRPGALGDAAFRQWRDTYDEGACSDAGSTVQGHAEAQISGRTVYIGTCATAFRTYHVRLDKENLLISAWSTGEGGFGEALMAGLRVPA